MGMKEKELRALIDEIFNRHIRIAWINPYTPKSYIPAESVLSLKEEILELFKSWKRSGGYGKE